VQDGICIRLYAEDDFAERPRFTQPEIQRANLAEVILRMKAFRLGEIEKFPFLNPPQSASIRAGYRLLHELGAIDDTNELTPLGHELARLPLDPTLGRMLLQARAEKALPEMLIIAAGLSVPDPRERPEEQKEAAAAAHRAFADADSDFLTLLAIWKAAPPAEARGGGNALRRFCKANFLSVSRMREWRDIHRQLADAIEEEPTNSRSRGQVARVAGNAAAPATPDAVKEASYPAIHRAVLTGLLGQIAQRLERNLYKAAGDRQVTLFPGSNLYERREKARKTSPTAAAEKSRQPAWIMAGEIVETSQLFARTAAGINPEWVVELGAHLCQFRYTEPHWSAKAGRVLVLERVLVHGLEISRQHVDHGKINPVEATELFIRGALVAEEARLPLRFFEHNMAVREKIETALTRVRSRRAHDLEEALYQFYAARVEGVSSVHDLNRCVRSRITREPDFLCATESDLIGDDEATYDRALFPDRVSLGNTALPVTYSYAPGAEADGVTVRVPLPVASQLTYGSAPVDGARSARGADWRLAARSAEAHPQAPHADRAEDREVSAEFDPGRADFLEALAGFLTKKYRVPVQREDWPPQSLPAHLQLRVEIVDRADKTVLAGRDLAALQTGIEKREERSDAWEKAVRKWERRQLTVWDFGDLPESVVIEEVGGAPLLAYPGLAVREGEVDLRLFRNAMKQKGRHRLACDGSGSWSSRATSPSSGRNSQASRRKAAATTSGPRVCRMRSKG
jgi:ATP-dependent helicase HrpA